MTIMLCLRFCHFLNKSAWQSSQQMSSKLGPQCLFKNNIKTLHSMRYAGEKVFRTYDLRYCNSELCSLQPRPY